MEEIERPGAVTQPELDVSSALQQYELDKQLIRKTLDAFNAYTFAMKGACSLWWLDETPTVKLRI